MTSKVVVLLSGGMDSCVTAAIAAALDKSFDSPSPNLFVLEQLARGELTVEEALEKMS